MAHSEKGENSTFYSEIPPSKNPIFDPWERKVITLVEYKRKGKDSYYINSNCRLELAREGIRRLKKIYRELTDNNPLNKRNSQVIVDECTSVMEQNLKVIKKKGSFLRKMACTVGIAIGIWTSLSSSTMVVNSPHEVVSEDPNFDDSFQEDLNNIGDLNINVEKNLDTNNDSKIFDSQLIQKNNKQKQVCLGDTFCLNNTTLYYSSLKDHPTVNTDVLDFDQYKVRYISVISNGDVIDLVRVNEKNKDMTWKEFKNNYSNLDVHFQINVDGLLDHEIICKRVGWTSLSNIKKNKSNSDIKIKNISR